MGHSHKQSIAHLIDFSLSNWYQVSTSHIPCVQYQTLTGTPCFLSINGHHGLKQSCCNDLESLAYLLVYLLQGLLSWQGLEAKLLKEKYTYIMQKKI